MFMAYIIYTVYIIYAISLYIIYAYLKTYQIVYIKCVHLFVCQSYINKVI